ncbi:ABC transporter ATP-binding protein [Nocardiopsis halotolerans]|uniref:ABC transporter ATP-binding protein n=1 Tax=Nocardiopsis halotolerans TaxID=124252 RepID=UPI000348E9F5|nr:ABC transporter ATP-binding protein [Nocardiopsis halotolerans]
MPDTATLVEARDVTMRFGTFTALDGVGHAFGGTGVCGLIGVNGAGKTTFIHTLIGLLSPTSGTVSGEGTHETIAYCPDTPSFEPYLTSREVLTQSALLGRGRRARPAPEDVERCLTRVGLAEHVDRRVGGFSRGMRQRLGMAAALIREPKLLILDEPTSALDPVGRDDVLALVAELGRDIRVVFSSHILEDVESVADDLVVLNRGRLVYSGPKEGFIGSGPVDTEVRYVLRDGVEEFCAHLVRIGVPCRLEDDASGTVVIPFAYLATSLGFLRDRPRILRALTVGDGSSLQRAFLETVTAEEA